MDGIMCNEIPWTNQYHLAYGKFFLLPSAAATLVQSQETDMLLSAAVVPASRHL